MGEISISQLASKKISVSPMAVKQNRYTVYLSPKRSALPYICDVSVFNTLLLFSASLLTGKHMADSDD